MNRDEVLSMITQALRIHERYRRTVGSAVQERLAQAEEQPFHLFADPDTLVRLQLSEPRTQHGTTCSRHIIISRRANSDVTQVVLNALASVYSPGGPEAKFDFPPNDTHLLEEFRRAQNHALLVQADYHRTENGLILDHISVARYA